MNYKHFLISSICSIFYGLFLKYEKPDWKTAKSIVTKVKVNDTVINNINGLEISEIQSNADVIYKIEDKLHTTNVNVTKNQPLQIGNTVPIQYNLNNLKRIERNIPETKYWFLFGFVLFFISLCLYKRADS